MFRIESLIQLVYRYELRSYLLEWAGIFRYLGSNPKGFTLLEWKALSRGDIHNTVIESLFRILGEQQLIKVKDGAYQVIQEHELQRLFETIGLLTELIESDAVMKNNDKLLWTQIPDYNDVPIKISRQFQSLNSWIQHLIQLTRKRLIFFAPYYSIAGMEHLLISLSTLLEIRQDVTVDWIVGETKNLANQKAFEYLSKKLGSVSQIQVYEANGASNKRLAFHAKLLLSDNEKGYLGSANFSHGGLHNQFELGVRLTKEQTRSLSTLIDYWITSYKVIPIKL